ncbi:MAG: RrF2 family transcriptional regulator [Candidatus Kryptoniota bacterium]
MNSFLTREQDYALRITTYLAALKGGERVSVSELSKRLYISRNFAARIVHKLKKANITGAVHGRYGGIFLKISPSELSVWDIIEAFGLKVRFNACLHDSYNCELEPACNYHFLFAKVEHDLSEYLRKRKVSDFLFNIDNTKN